MAVGDGAHGKHDPHFPIEQIFKTPEEKALLKTAVTFECIYCHVVLSDAESANGGKVCDTCAYDNGDHCIEDDVDDEIAEAEMNCGMGRDGRCSQAGTEHCDWVCPLGR